MNTSSIKNEEDKHLMPPIKTLSEPFQLMRSLSVRVGGNATESVDKKLHICKHNVINRTHFTRKIAGDGSIRAPRSWDLARKQLIIMDVVTHTKAGGGATCHPSRNGADQLLLSGVRRKLNRGRQPQSCLSAASLAVPSEPGGK